MRRSVATLVLCAGLASAGAGQVCRAAEPRLVRDIDPSVGQGSSAPRDLVELGERVVFDAVGPGRGRELWVSDGTPGGTRLIRDICPGSCSTSFRWLWAAGGRWFFDARPEFPETGVEEDPAQVPGWGLWSTDGTAAGTHFIGDVGGMGNRGSLGFLETSGIHFFAARDEAHGSEPWRSDGTAGGTWRLADLMPGPADSLGFCYSGAVRGAHLLFAAATPDLGCELWRSDGSSEGTAMVRDIHAGAASSWPSDLAALGDRVVFRAIDEDHGAELWASDGTRAGTALLTEIVPGAGWTYFAESAGANFHSAGDRVHFLAARKTVRDQETGAFVPLLELWQTDGSAAGTRQLTHFGSATAFSRDFFDPDLPHYMSFRFTVVGAKAYFSADDGQSGRELWVSDGTSGGTHRLADLCPGACDSEPVLFRPIGEEGFAFEARDGIHGREMWVSDGTAAGTRMVADLCPGDCGVHVVGNEVLGGALIFAAAPMDGDGPSQLWATGVTPASARELESWALPTAFHDPRPLSTVLDVPTARIGNQVLFVVDDGVHGRELWTTGGTPGSTRLLSDLVGEVGNGSGPNRLTRHGLRLYFTADDGVRGFELWTTDGTAAGTRPVLDSAPECAECRDRFRSLTSIGGLLYYWFERGFDHQLWRSDGTPSGTFPLGEFGNRRDSFGQLAGEVYFLTQDELWKTDGTVGGTTRVAGLPSDSGSTAFVRLGDALYFHSDQENLPTTLWRTDGTAAGTEIVSDAIHALETVFPRSLLELGGKLFFGATDGEDGYELWVSDGTTGGTHPLTDLASEDDGGRPALIGVVGGRVVFQTRAPEGGYTLWATDGTPGGTVPLAETSGWAGAGVLGRSRGRDVLYFRAEDKAHGAELWRTDGTPSGTRIVRDIRPGPGTSHPGWLTAIGDAMFFTAFDPAHGEQLWRSDGTPGGTFGITSAEAGLDFSTFGTEHPISWLGDKVVFVAADPEHGRELWSLPLDAGPVGPPGGGPPEGNNPLPPAGSWLATGSVPGFRFKVRIAPGAGSSIAGAAEPTCIPETLCVSGAVPGRSEVFLRVVGPKPNGKLWPTLVKFTTSEVEVWIEQLSSGDIRYYRLEGAGPGSSELPGLFDRDGFDP